LWGKDKMDDETKIVKVWKWYSRPDVQFEIIKQTKNKECAFLVPSWCDELMKKRSTRMLKVHNIKSLKFMFKCLSVFSSKTLMNLYYSVAKYKNGIPNQDMNLARRNNEDWNNTHYHEIETYDYVIDIDAGNFKEIDMCFESAKNIKFELDRFKVPYSLRYSGKGFHFVIPYSCFKNADKLNFNPSNSDNIYKYFALLTKILYHKYSEMIDTTIYDSRRVLKIPYTLAIYEKEIYVCYPFESDEEFFNFKLRDYNIKHFNKLIRERGIKTFNESGTATKWLKSLQKDIEKLRCENGKTKR
jgi:hypothetical protein